MKTLAIIPGRIGSKGVPLKNIRKIAGQSLIEHTINSAKKFNEFDKIIISTDNKKIAKIGEKHGIEVPFLRPKNISKSKSSAIDYVSHSLGMLESEQNFIPDIITILQPTSSIRDPQSIKKSMRILKTPKTTSVISVTKTKNHPYLSFWYPDRTYLKPIQSNFKKYYQRQKFPTCYYPTGSIYTFWTSNLKKYDSIYGPKIKPLIIQEEDSIDIDSPFDFFVAEMRLLYWEKYKKKFC